MAWPVRSQEERGHEVVGARQTRIQGGNAVTTHLDQCLLQILQVT